MEEKEVVVSVDRRLLLVVGLLVVFGAAVGVGALMTRRSSAPPPQVADAAADGPPAVAQIGEADVRATAVAMGLGEGVTIVTAMATIDPANDPFNTPPVPVNPQPGTVGQAAGPTPVPGSAPNPNGPPEGQPTVPLPDAQNRKNWSPETYASFPDANLTREYQPARIEAVTGTVDGPRLAISDLNEQFTYNFGDIPDNKPASHRFTAKNVGNEDLTVIRIYTGCGCTATTVGSVQIQPDGFLPDPLVLKPGESQDFGIEFDPRAEQSEDTHISQAKFIQLYSNDPNGPLFTDNEPNSHESRFRIVVRPVFISSQ